MLFKLAFKNMRKNLKDYVIYFITLVLGVAIFYIFNSMGEQQASMQMSQSKMNIVQMMVEMLSGVSVFVSIVLGFLIVYANNFLIKRRKKEFGLYMLLGMGKVKITKILLLETVLVGLFSLGIGLVIGIFASQLMSILVARMFEADLTRFEFILSNEALIKTVVYFAIMFGAVMILNLLKTSRYKLIDLLTAGKKNESVKLKKPIISVLLFIVSVIILGIAYYLAITEITSSGPVGVLIAIGLGIIGTFMFFYSLSGFALRLIQTSKKIYYKNLNVFILRQINSKINTTVFSMGVISILLFLTICIFSSAVSINDTTTKQLKELNPADVTISKIYSTENVSQIDSISIKNILENSGFSLDNFSKYEMVSSYSVPEITLKTTLGNKYDEINKQTAMIYYEGLESFMKLSDYNDLQELYGGTKQTLNDNEYIIICNYDEAAKMRNIGLQSNTKITINGKDYFPRDKECVNAVISISAQPMESGKIIVPDSALKEEWKTYELLSAKYNAETEEGKQDIEKALENSFNSNKSPDLYSELFIRTKITNYDASVGLGATVTFIGLYLGVIFLISSSAILALKELSDSSDNKQRYDILRKIGVDEKMINKALFKQIGIFFFIPLLLAIVHSIFGMIVAEKILNMFGKQDLLPSIIATAGFIILIYGGYFVATYVGSKNIIKD